MSIVYQRSFDLYQRAKNILAGGVSSEFRKYNSPHPLFYTHGSGSHIFDVDGNDYLDFTLSQGPLILGHSHPEVLSEVANYSQSGQLFAGQHIKELELAEKLGNIIPCAELLRFSLDGSESVHTALRVARAKTGRALFIRFEGHYHGWLDNMCWGISRPPDAKDDDETNLNSYPWSGGLPSTSATESILLPWNNLEIVERTIKQRHSEIAAIITEPMMCNSSCIAPKPGFLQGLRRLCDDYGIALIFDEVITGFRVDLGGAQKKFGVIPDLSIFGKAMSSGYPISALVGKKEWMETISSGLVIHAGTMNSNNPTVAAALSTIDVLEREQPFGRLYTLGNLLMDGLRKLSATHNQNLLVQGPGPVFHTGFTDLKEVTNFRDCLQYDKAKLSSFVNGMQSANVRIIGRGLWYLSAAHTEQDIEFALEAADKSLSELK